MKAFYSILFLFTNILYSFGAAAIPENKSIIVQFSKAMDTDALEELSGYHFYHLKPLNVNKTLWSFKYFSSVIPEYHAIEIIRSLPFYTLHQIDSEIEMRSTKPNDTLFGNQWHLPIIKATEAWDLNRKGVNRNGDTIVIAVIDDGLHINHPDFQGNIWINYADTADNGIDDDNNGYIDDHYGWNYMGQDNDISDSNYYKAGHGTPVAGIIGARGNNITGVTGIMWHVKLMILNFTDTGSFPLVFQSDVLEAYSYVLNQRKLYNQSNGNKGAFVVATNSSWGVDGKFPHHAPIWCSMYDTLGKYGILNVSAVSNNSQNQVDADGDLPTLCPSLHLITVSSTSSNDNLYSSGYSTLSVDLSAPGSSIFSTGAYTKENILLKRIYRNGFSGTSFACPMVTAAVGVLQAYACERVLDSIRLNPAKGNAMMRKFILEGVDVIDGLGGKSVTSGRLNIKKSMEIMDQYCYGNVGIYSVSNTIEIYIFPNPGNGIIEIETDEIIRRVSITDLSGRTYKSNLLDGQMDMSYLEKGMYYITIETEKGVSVLKYIKTE